MNSNSKTWLERVTKGKPFSLLGLVVSDEGKKFYSTDTWLRWGSAAAWCASRKSRSADVSTWWSPLPESGCQWPDPLQTPRAGGSWSWRWAVSDAFRKLRRPEGEIPSSRLGPRTRWRLAVKRTVKVVLLRLVYTFDFAVECDFDRTNHPLQIVQHPTWKEILDFYDFNL